MQQVSLSRSLYEIPWEKYFPWQFKEGHEVRLSDFETCFKFIADHASEIENLNSPNGFLDEELFGARERYYRIAGDFLAFYLDGTMVGLYIGTPFDWSSYYLRFAWIRPEFRKKGFYRAFLSYKVQLLAKHGISRAIAEVSPSNIVSLKVFTDLKFTPTGFTVSERFGSLTQLTKFLNAKNGRFFFEKLCRGENFQRELEPTKSLTGDMELV